MLKLLATMGGAETGGEDDGSKEGGGHRIEIFGNPQTLNLEEGRGSLNVGDGDGESDSETETDDSHLQMLEEEEEEIKHPCHEHLLSYFEKWPGHRLYRYNCDLCKENCNVDLFLCKSCWEDNPRKCDFRLHRRCAELPQEITSSHHDPNHKLTIYCHGNGDEEEDKDSQKLCEECSVPIGIICYSCSHCDDFKLHPLCAITVASSAKKIQHCTHHEHPLTFFEDLPPNISSVNCQLCSEVCDGDLFLCLPCKHKGNDFRLHKRCAEQPEEITPPSHNPNHKLIMSAQELKADYYAKKGSPCPQLCGKCVVPLCFYNFNYCCSHCDFALHPLCAWSSASSSAEDYQGAYEICKQVSSSFKHIAHHHDMVLYELDKVSLILKKLSNKDDDIVCAWCGDLVSSGMFYACLTCGFHLHKGCAFDMPGDQIVHPSHQQHSLHLTVDKTGVGVICFVCGDVLDNSICFTCGVCDNLIGLHARCASGLLQIGSNLFNKRKQKQLEHPGKVAKEIQHFAHEHPLVYGENNKSPCCYLCNKKCDEGSCFFCESCERWDAEQLHFSLHRRCAEQPEQIIHSRHPHHKLTRFRSYIIGDREREDLRLCNECLLPLSMLRFIYCCLHCDFNIHFSCAMAVAQGRQFGSTKVSRFKHTAHRHSLILYQQLNKITQILPYDANLKIEITSCAWCGKPILLSDKLYACFICDLYLHQGCTFDIPRRIRHPFYQSHPLSIQFFDSNRLYCDVCDDTMNLSIGFHGRRYMAYRAGAIHGRCACLLPSLKSKHHNKHDLTYFHKAKYPTVCSKSACSKCKDQIGSKRDKFEGFYRCVACNTSFHLSCILRATEIHKYHKWHMLALHNSSRKDNDFYSDEVYCDICEMRRDSNHCVYRCETCDIFDAHIECAIGQKRNNEPYGYAAILKSLEVVESNTSAKSSVLIIQEGQIKHPDHDHVLDLEDVVKFKRRDCYCRACNLKVSGQAYTCISCPDYFLHQVCANLSMSPAELVYDSPAHSFHPLALYFKYSRGEWFICDACGDINGQDCFSYRCQKCEFIIDFKCVYFNHKAPRLNKFKHLVSVPFHRHPLRLGNCRNERKRLYCSACVNPITGLTYCCLLCWIFLHESCSFGRFPQKLQLPFHPISFELDTLIIDQIRPNCLACQFSLRGIGLYYKCRYCLTRRPHYLHPTCAITLKRPLVYKAHHEHNLYYFDRESQIMFRFLRREMGTIWHECTQCHESCTGAFYYCMDCRSYFHLECLPIPQVVKSKCHLHNLNLEKSFMDEGYDLDDQHCDICEEKRKPEDHVYVCKECSIPFAGHIECVLPRMHRVIETTYQRPLWNQYDLDSNDEKIVSEAQKQPFKLKVKEIFNQVLEYRVDSVDLHQTNPWILAVFLKYNNYGAYIWNYESQKKEQWLKQMDELSSVRSAKFISRENLIVLGGENGFISIYNHDTSEIIYTFKAHEQTVECVVVHSSCPYVLSSSYDGLIKLWNWEKGWSCTREFHGHSARHRNIQAEFNPIDDNAFASALQEDYILIWNIDSPDPIRVYQTSSEENTRYFTCFRFLKVGAELYILLGTTGYQYRDGYVKVFDYKTKTCIQTLEEHEDRRILAISAHPDLPVIITSSYGKICIWSSLNWSLLKTLRYGNGGAHDIISCIKGSNRVVFGNDGRLAMVELTLIEKECDRKRKR